MSDLERLPRHQYPNAFPQPGDLSATPVTTIDIPGAGLKRDYAGLLEYWQMARRHKAAIVAAMCLGCLAGFLMTLTEPRVYQARTTLEFQGLNEEFLNIKAANPNSDSSGGYLDTDIQTQVRLLQSDVLRTRVTGKLEAGAPPQGLQPPDRLGMWRQALRIGPPTQDQLWKQALGTAAGSVRVRASGTNRIIEVTCDSTNGQVAADYCNTLTTEFIDQNLEARWKTSEYTGEWLTKQLGDLKIKIEQQGQELQQFASATGLIVAGATNEIADSNLAELQKELLAAQADRIAKQSKFEMASTSPTGSLPDVLDDEALTDLETTKRTLETKLAQLKVTYTLNHAEVRRVQAQIDAVNAASKATHGNISIRIRKEYEAAQRREKLLADAYTAQARLLSGQAEETARYTLLKREFDASRLMYDNLQQRLKEANISAALRANIIRVVDGAQAPRSPYKPDVQQRVTFGLMLGFVLGMAFAVLRERSDRTLQDPGDVTYYLGLPELGVVPTGDLSEGMKKGRAAAGRFDADRHHYELVSFREKQSLLAESFRTTLTSILFSYRNGARPRIIVLTSASPKEGKTTVVSNLGIALAEIKQRVLVIDADMRRPRLHKVFDVDNDRGLSNLLLESTPLDQRKLEDACWSTPIPGLHVLASGSARTQASTLLHSPRLPELINLAREMFDTVIIDTPPMVNIADARVLARMSDALILVVRSGSTTRDAALLAKTRFAEDGTPVLGTILNQWNPSTPGYGYYKYYYAGYYHYYGQGGNGNGNGSGGGDGDGHGGPRVVDDEPRTDGPSLWQNSLRPRPSQRTVTQITET